MNETFNQMFKLPLAVVAWWMGWLAQMAKGMQQIAEQGSAAMAPMMPGAPGGNAAPGGAMAAATLTDSLSGVVPIDQGAGGTGAETEVKKEKQIMADKDLSNDRVKLVEYSIVSIERGRERTLHDGEKLVSSNMTGEDFAIWVIAEYVQEHPVPHDIKKYLRVCYEVNCSWAREPLHYEEKQLDALEGIRRAIEVCCEEGGRPFRREVGERGAGQPTPTPAGGRGRGGAGAGAGA
jgi:hypothetical protein